jgi:hypothetical protein
MPTDYYQGLEDEPQQTPAESATTLVPKSLVGDSVDVGDTVTLKVEHIYEDEVEVSLVSESDSDEDEMEEAEPEGQMPPEDELDSLMKG